MAAIEKDEFPTEFPTHLAGFGYEFKDGKMKNIKTGDPFQFVVKEGDQAYNQKHYEALGEVITEEVYKLLESECNLKRSPIPINASKKEPSTFIFVSEDALKNTDRLLVLIHGSGVVRAGQWARRLIINESLDWGTQIPFIKEAQKNGYGILVMNTNDNSRAIEGSHKRQKIKESSSPEQHARYVWKKIVRKANAKHIAVIAHSYGGCVTTDLFLEEKKDFAKRVFAVAMTDSVHYISRPEAFKPLVKVACNWVSSSQPLDTKLSTMRGDITRVSSGVNVHEKTSYSSIESVFKFLDKRYDAVTKGVTEEEEADEESGVSSSQEEPLGRKMSVGSEFNDSGEEPGGKAVAPGNHQMSDSDTEEETGEVNANGGAGGQEEGGTDKGATKEDGLERAMSIVQEGGTDEEAKEDALERAMSIANDEGLTRKMSIGD